MFPFHVVVFVYVGVFPTMTSLGEVLLSMQSMTVIIEVTQTIVISCMHFVYALIIQLGIGSAFSLTLTRLTI